MRILICGDRNWTDREKIAQQLRIIAWTANEAFGTDFSCRDSDDIGVTIIHGTARGADRIAGEEAKKLGFEVREYPAEWQMGRAAGPIRNQVMLDDGKPDFILAFHSNIEESKGTADMVRRAKQANLPVEVIR